MTGSLVNKLREHMDTTKEEEASAATEAELLTEIRDLLASNKV